MSRLIFCTLLALIPVICRADLVAHWPLDETSGTRAKDVVGNRIGQLNNFPVTGTQWVEGKIGGALRFDGNNDYVEHYFDLPRKRGTLMHWVRPDSDSNGIIYYENDYPAEDADYNGFNSGGPVLEIHTLTDGRYGFYYQDGAMENMASRRFINPQGWDHVAVTWDVDGDMVLYTNCEEVDREDLSGVSFDNNTTSNRYFGRAEHDSDTRSFAGLLDDVRVYDHAMGHEEILAFCDLGAGRHSAVAGQDGAVTDETLARHICTEILGGGGTQNIKDITLLVNSPFGGGYIDDMEQVFGPNGQCAGIPWVAAVSNREDEISRGWSDDEVDQFPGNRLGSTWTQALAGDGFGNVNDGSGAIYVGSSGNNVLGDLEAVASLDQAGLEGLGLETPGVANGNDGDLIQWRQNGSRHEAILFSGMQTDLRHQNNLVNVREALERTWQGEEINIETIEGGSPEELLMSITNAAQNFDQDTQLLVYLGGHGEAILDFEDAFGSLEDFEIVAGTSWDFRLHEGWLKGLAGNRLSESAGSAAPRLLLDIDACQSCGAMGYYFNGRKLDFPSQTNAGLVEIPLLESDFRNGRNNLEITSAAGESVAQVSGNNTGKPASNSMKVSRLQLSSGPVNDLTVQHQLVPGQSGAFYDPDRNGEGIFVELLDGQRAVVYIFSYDGEDPGQSWMVGTGDLVGNGIVVSELVRPTGAKFGSDFNPDDVKFHEFGSLVLQLPECGNDGEPGNLVVSTSDGDFSPLHSNNYIQLTQLVDCETNERPPNAGLSGSWYDPDHNGEGIILEVLINGRGLVQWFTYDKQGRSMWLQGIGDFTGRTLAVDQLITTGGALWGNAFDSEDVEMIDWGRLTMIFDGCNAATVNYESTAAFGSGALQMERLTRLLGNHCEE